MKKKNRGNRFDHLEFEQPSVNLDKDEEQVPIAQPPRGILSEAPMERHAYHDRAIQMFQRGEFEQALRYFTRTLELDRGYVPAWVGQVQMLIELNELREADLWAAKALEMFRDQGELLAAKGVVKVRQREHSEAMACSDAALANRGSSAYRWLARGEILLARDETQVQACFDRAMLEADADWFTRVWAARIFHRYNRYTQGLLWVRQATDLAPDQPYAWYVRGLCERDLAIGGYVSSLKHSLEIDPTFMLARKTLREGVKESWFIRWGRRFRGK